MKAISVLLFLLASFKISAQNIDSLVQLYNNVRAYDSMINARLDKYYYQAFDINHVDTIRLPDTLLIMRQWTFGSILFACCDRDNKEAGYRALNAFLRFHEEKGQKIKLMHSGLTHKIPNIDELYTKEKETGFLFVPTLQTMGCLQSTCVNEIEHRISCYYGDCPQTKNK